VAGVRIGDLPLFNADDVRYRLTLFDGWFTVAAPDAVLVGVGGGLGAVAVGGWEPVEAYYTLSGVMAADSRDEAESLREMLLRGLPAHETAPVEVIGEGKQVYLRRYDRPEISIVENLLSFTVPCVAPDPLKYALDPVGGDMGVFTGQTWFRTYAETSAGRWTRAYTLVDGRWVRTYQQAVPSGPYPLSLSLFSDGDAASSRVTVTVNGPVTAGDWWLINETTGERLWAELSVAAGQQLVFDMKARTARLNGAPVDHLVFGDWLTLAAGQNLLRLVSGTQSDAFASVSALPAYL
jgi:hypothetical protein